MAILDLMDKAKKDAILQKKSVIAYGITWGGRGAATADQVTYETEEKKLMETNVDSILLSIGKAKAEYVKLDRYSEVDADMKVIESAIETVFADLGTRMDELNTLVLSCLPTGSNTFPIIENASGNTIPKLEKPTLPPPVV